MKVLYLTFVVFVADQLSKIFVKGFSIPLFKFNWEGIDYGQSINVIGDFLRITFVENPGMAFGLDVGPIQKLILSIFTFIAVIGIFWYLYKSRERDLALRIGLALILAGALGNLIDRALYGVFYGYAPLMYGRVVDFIQVEFWDFTLFGHTYETWPIFNIADSAVTVGVAVIILFHKGEKQVADSEEKKLTEELGTTEINNGNIEHGENNNREEIQI